MLLPVLAHTNQQRTSRGIEHDVRQPPHKRSEGANHLVYQQLGTFLLSLLLSEALQSEKVKNMPKH